MEVEIDLVTFTLESLCKVECVIKTIGTSNWVNPYAQAHSVHTSITQDRFRSSCLIVSTCVLVDCTTLFKSRERAEVMSLIEVAVVSVWVSKKLLIRLLWLYLKVCVTLKAQRPQEKGQQGGENYESAWRGQWKRQQWKADRCWENTILEERWAFLIFISWKWPLFTSRHTPPRLMEILFPSQKAQVELNSVNKLLVYHWHSEVICPRALFKT